MSDLVQRDGFAGICSGSEGSIAAMALVWSCIDVKEQFHDIVTAANDMCKYTFIISVLSLLVVRWTSAGKRRRGCVISRKKSQFWNLGMPSVNSGSFQKQAEELPNSCVGSRYRKRIVKYRFEGYI